MTIPGSKTRAIATELDSFAHRPSPPLLESRPRVSDTLRPRQTARPVACATRAITISRVGPRHDVPNSNGVSTMISLRVALASLATVALAGSAAADDAGNFVYRLGQDTTSVEHYTRSASKLELDQVGRAPRTLRRHYTIDSKSGAVAHVAIVASPPGAPAPFQTVDAMFGADSMRMDVKSATGSVQRVTLVV